MPLTLHDAETQARAALAATPHQDPSQVLDTLAQKLGGSWGTPNWASLRLELKATAVDETMRAELFKYALFEGHIWKAEAYLRVDPKLAESRMDLRLATYDVEAVKAAAEADPLFSDTYIGVRRPILHLAFSKWHQGDLERQKRSVEVAEILLGNGANINDAFPSGPGEEPTLTVLYGALGHADNRLLADFLIEKGAFINDNESLYHSTEQDSLDGLKSLLAKGAKIGGTNALLRAMDFDRLDMVQALLDAGANPDSALTAEPEKDGHPALMHAAMRGCSVQIIEALLAAGADPLGKWLFQDLERTAYQVAHIYGHQAMIDLFDERGFASLLSEEEQALYACAKGESASLPKARLQAIAPLLEEIAMRPGAEAQLKALIEAGLDPKQGGLVLPPLHAAAWAGLPKSLEVMLAVDQDLDRKNGYGGNVIDSLFHGINNAPASAAQDYLSCTKMLISRGARITQGMLDFCEDQTMVADMSALMLSA